MYTKSQLGVVAVTVLVFSTQVHNEEVKCKEELSVDITDGTVNGKQITKDDIIYTDQNYYQNGDRIYGCPCNIRNCTRKCCPHGEGLDNKTCRSYENDAFSVNLQRHLPEDVHIDHYYIVHDIVDCNDKERFLLDPNGDIEDIFLITQDGRLTWQGLEFNVIDYCVDYLIQQNTFAALLCADAESVYHHTIGTKIIFFNLCVC